jgi:hypothetical protein
MFVRRKPVAQVTQFPRNPQNSQPIVFGSRVSLKVHGVREVFLEQFGERLGERIWSIRALGGGALISKELAAPPSF